MSNREMYRHTAKPTHIIGRIHWLIDTLTTRNFIGMTPGAAPTSDNFKYRTVAAGKSGNTPGRNLPTRTVDNMRTGNSFVIINQSISNLLRVHFFHTVLGEPQYIYSVSGPHWNQCGSRSSFLLNVDSNPDPYGSGSWSDFALTKIWILTWKIYLMT